MSPEVGPLPRALVAGVAVALSGCPRAPPPDLSRDPAALLEAVRAAQGRVRSVRGSARVRVESPRVSGTVNQYLAAEKPDRIRLETHDFFGNVAAVLVTDGGRFALYDAREGAYYRGQASPENVSRLLPLVLPPEELAAILCGSAPLLAGEPISAEPRGAQLLLTIGAGAGEQRLAVGAEAAVEASQLRRPGAAGGGEVAERPDYDLEFEVFRHRGGARFPTEVTLRAPAARVRLQLRWKEDLRVNGPADPASFRLDPPRGARVVELSPGSAAPAVELPLEPAPRQ